MSNRNIDYTIWCLITTFWLSFNSISCANKAVNNIHYTFNEKLLFDCVNKKKYKNVIIVHLCVKIDNSHWKLSFCLSCKCMYWLMDKTKRNTQITYTISFIASQEFFPLFIVKYFVILSTINLLISTKCRLWNMFSI